MRKFFLSALACVAFASSAFASNEIVVEKGIFQSTTKIDINQKKKFFSECIVEIWGYNSGGEWILKRSYKIRIYPYKSCSEAVAAINKTLNPTPKTN